MHALWGQEGRGEDVGGTADQGKAFESLLATSGATPRMKFRPRVKLPDAPMRKGESTSSMASKLCAASMARQDSFESEKNIQAS